MLFKALSLALSATALHYPPHIRGQGPAPGSASPSAASSARPLLENVFYVELADSTLDCASYVTSHLLSAGVSSSDITVRTNYNLGGYGNVCSVEVAGHQNEIFDLPGAVMYAVHGVAPLRPLAATKAQSQNVKATTEQIHALTGVARARSELGLTGKGIKVAVIDTGVYYLHPALGAGFGKGFKVGYGYDLVGDAYGNVPSVTTPDADPLDNCSGDSHGTHVAGIIAGDARGMPAGFVPPVEWTGAAPGATIGAYRIFGCGANGTSRVEGRVLFVKGVLTL